MATLTKPIILEWVRDATGAFTYRDLYVELDVGEEENRSYARKVMKELCQEKVLKAIDGKHGMFRLVDKEAPVLNWKGVSNFDGLNIRWPFSLEDFVKVYPRNVIVVGGDPNEGKTTFLHNVIALNWRSFPIILFDSENSEKELALKFAKYPDHTLWPDDLAREKSQNFADVIEPDYINIIDYLEITDSFYVVAKLLREIRDALSTGIAIVAIQKAKGAELPLGRDFSRQIARLVLTIDPGMLTIRKAKAFAQKNVNPNNMKFSFQVNDEAKFINIQRSY